MNYQRQKIRDNFILAISFIIISLLCSMKVSCSASDLEGINKNNISSVHEIENDTRVLKIIPCAIPFETEEKEKEEEREKEIETTNDYKEIQEVEAAAEQIDSSPIDLNENELMTDDREKPIYAVYKGGFFVDVPAELQWYIHDMCEEYQFYEKYVYGMILCESTFYAKAENEGCYGLCQINSFWIDGANIEHFTDDYYKRDLKDPYDNLLTLSEMWCYAKKEYNLDLMTEDGMMRVCYWHNTGQDPSNITSSNYFDVVKKYADELAIIIY